MEGAHLDTAFHIFLARYLDTRAIPPCKDKFLVVMPGRQIGMSE
jgi:hypothetical protein